MAIASSITVLIWGQCENLFENCNFHMLIQQLTWLVN